MSTTRFSDLPDGEQEWIDHYLDGTISPEDFELLQDRMRESPELREVIRRSLSVQSALEQSAEKPDSAAEAWLNVAPLPAEEQKTISFPRILPIAAAAGLAFLLGIGMMYLQSPPNGADDGGSLVDLKEEASAEGFAVIGNLFDARWKSREVSRREGDLLGSEVFHLASGTAEIQFFSGAMMTVEGPAEISLKSAWEATCSEGSVRMRVPPAARGFKLHSPSSEIIDLGTEFGLQVRDGIGHVEVFDGEIAVKHQGEKEKLIQKGAAFSLPPDASAKASRTGEIDFPDVKNFGTRIADEQISNFKQWENYRDELSKDDRLIAYYDFDREGGKGLIPNLTIPRNPEFDGAVVLAEPVDGRWPSLKSALEFRRPGSRVRVNIPGEFSAFTFAAWVRIDSLDRVYNALFMGDGYENGEPHWQIREDGKMMLSIMVDDTRPNPGAPHDAGLHRVYYSPPIWEMSMSGQWMHLASVFDPSSKKVSHYVDGKRISEQRIEEKFFIDTLQIGNGEIGNWGQPFREDPWFAIRNLNGRVDEFAIFNAALGDEEIAELYKQSRSGQR